MRQIVRVSMGARRVRVRLSNAYGATPLDVGSAHLAIHGQGPSIVAGSDRALTFGGSTSVSIPSGALVLSDPVSLSVPALSGLAISLYLPGSARAATEHSFSQQTTYVSTVGDFCGAETLADATARQSWYLVAGVEAEGSTSSGAVVALGDSITDGAQSTTDANHRWPDFLADRLSVAPGPVPRAVVNAGIAGNRLVGELVGDSALARFDRDVLSQSGARYVIVLEGINDIGVHASEQEAGTDPILSGYRQIVLRAHALGLKVFGGTLIPFEGTTLPGFYTPAGERRRQAINGWIRTSGVYDAVIDFDRATRDPTYPTRLSPAFDSGDHLHPNDAGYKAMADAVDLSLFDDGGD